MASGATLFTLKPQDRIGPATDYATFDIRNGHLVLEFDPGATVERADFEGVLPRNYAGGGITVTIGFMVDTATSGNVVWGVAFERHDDESLDLDSDSLASEGTVTAAAPATTGMVQYCTIAFTNGAAIDSLSVGEHFRLRLRRVSSDAADTVNSNDAQWLFLEARET